MARSSIDPSELLEKALLVQKLSSLQSSLQMSDDQLGDKLTILFQNRKRSGGGDVKKVVYPLSPDKDDAIIFFEDSKGNSVGSESVIKQF